MKGEATARCRRLWLLSGASSFGAAGTCVVLLSGCTQCLGSLDRTPLPVAFIDAALTAAVLAGGLFAAAAWRNLRQLALIAAGISALVLCGLLPVAVHAGLTNSSFCNLCLAFWGFMAASVAVTSLWMRFTGLLTALVLVAGAIMPGLVRVDAAGASTRRYFAKIALTHLGLDYSGNRATLRKGQSLPPAVAVGIGTLLVATKCGPCTWQRAGQSLQSAGIRPDRLVILQPDQSGQWQVPPTYKSARRLIDSAAWKALSISEYGPPPIVEFANAKVVKVLE
ncbi:MAG: hypothetical protein ACYC96_05500 [Fimbriimonadaceae bacterium]